MKLKIDPKQFRYVPGKSHSLSKIPNSIDHIYADKVEYLRMLDEYTDEIKALQRKMYAHDRYSVLLIFQGMDAAGKDGAIRHVMTGINPAGVQVFSFKKPTSQELDHDWMWRTTCCLPERGRIGIFNRSYYEEVLVVKVHPEILTQYQRIPKEFISDVDQVFLQRYQDIAFFEDFLHRNGTKVAKFFLNLSYEEQRVRLIERIDREDKNWKMSLADLDEREHWRSYQNAFQDLLNHTSKENAPWYVIPADDKKNARLIISQIVLDTMNSLDMHYPKVSDEVKAELKEAKKRLQND